MAASLSAAAEVYDAACLSLEALETELGITDHEDPQPDPEDLPDEKEEEIPVCPSCKSKASVSRAGFTEAGSPEFVCGMVVDKCGLAVGGRAYPPDLRVCGTQFTRETSTASTGGSQ